MNETSTTALEKLADTRNGGIANALREIKLGKAPGFDSSILSSLLTAVPI